MTVDTTTPRELGLRIKKKDGTPVAEDARIEFRIKDSEYKAGKQVQLTCALIEEERFDMKPLRTEKGLEVRAWELDFDTDAIRARRLQSKNEVGTAARASEWHPGVPEDVQALLEAIEASNGFYDASCADITCRSRMNVPFRVMGGDEAATNAFLRAAYDRNMVGFRTKTPFGTGQWLRASFYTGTTVEQADALVAFMKAFARDWRTKGAACEPLASAANVLPEDVEAPEADETLPSPPTPPPKPNPFALAEGSTFQGRVPFAPLPKPKTGTIGLERRRIPGAISLDSGLPRLRFAH